jgi:hypothetical protein
LSSRCHNADIDGAREENAALLVFILSFADATSVVRKLCVYLTRAGRQSFKSPRLMGLQSLTCDNAVLLRGAC